MKVTGFLLVLLPLLFSTNGFVIESTDDSDHEGESDEIWELPIGLRGQPNIVDKPECLNYKILNESNRAKDNKERAQYCDKSLAKGWYRFQGGAGTRMPTACVSKNHCGTHAPGWLVGEHPAVAHGAVRRKVCFHWLEICCRWSSHIRVRNCGAFFVYELKPAPYCYLRYCADGGKGESGSGVSMDSSEEGSSPV